MKIEEGKYYRTRDGHMVGPMRRWHDSAPHPWKDDTGTSTHIWRDDGTSGYDGTPQLVGEWIDEPETPKLWRDMTPEEKGALFLAEFEGRCIEKKNPKNSAESWETLGFFDWLGDNMTAYRIRPEPKRETVTLHGAGYEWGQANEPCADDTHSITFDLIDGKPDPASIKMEAL